MKPPRSMIPGFARSAVLLLAGACAHPTTCDPAIEACGRPEVPASVGTNFQLGPGRVAAVTGTGLRVRFDSVASDSRCPIGAACVWAGSADVRLVVTDSAGEVWAGSLNTGLEPKSIPLKGYELTLIGVSPETRLGAKIDPKDYRATLRVRAPDGTAAAEAKRR